MPQEDISDFSLTTLNGLSYVEGKLDVPFSGIFIFLDDYLVDVPFVIKSFYKHGHLLIRIISQNGLIRSKVKYKGDNRTEFNIYDERGKLKTKHQMVDNILDGLSSFYSDGTLYMTVEFKQGRQHGNGTMYNIDGSIDSQEHYICNFGNITVIKT